MKIYPILLSLIFWGTAYSQNSLKRAEENFNNKNYSLAIEDYEKLNKGKNSPDIIDKLAECYRLEGNYPQAEKYYQELVRLPSSAPTNKLYLALALKNNGKCEEGKIWYDRYLKESANDSNKRVIKEFCPADKENATGYEYELNPVKVGKGNTMEAFSPIKYKDEIIFVSNKKRPWFFFFFNKNNFFDLYSGTFKDDEIKNILPLKGKINSLLYEGPAAFSKNRELLYFTRSKKNIFGIYSATKEGDKWTKIQPFEYNSNEYSNSHPAISTDEKYLFFVSNRPGGSGGMDLYYCKNSDGKWTEPVNIGKEVSSVEDELFPSIEGERDSLRLYFSRKAAGKNKMQVYITKLKEGKWTRPQALPYPVNTENDNFAVSITEPGRQGFITSNRSGKIMLYEMKFIPKRFIRGTTTDKNNAPIAGAEVILKNLTENETDTIITDSKGHYKMAIKVDCEYTLMAIQNNSFSKTEKFTTKDKTTPGTAEYNLSFDLLQEQKTKKKEKAAPNRQVLYSLPYEKGKWTINESSSYILDYMIEMMNHHPEMNIQISSYTDSKGSSESNEQLSRKRSQIILDYLAAKGISRKRLVARGMGEKETINGCKDGIRCSEEEHSINRRTEFEIIKQ